MIWAVPHGIEQRFAHLQCRTVDHQRIGALFRDQIVDGLRKSRREDLVAEIAQRKRQKLGNLRRIVDEQYAAQASRYF